MLETVRRIIDTLSEAQAAIELGEGNNQALEAIQAAKAAAVDRYYLDKVEAGCP